MEEVLVKRKSSDSDQLTYSETMFLLRGSNYYNNYEHSLSDSSQDEP